MNQPLPASEPNLSVDPYRVRRLSVLSVVLAAVALPGLLLTASAPVMFLFVPALPLVGFGAGIPALVCARRALRSTEAAGCPRPRLAVAGGVLALAGLVPASLMILFMVFLMGAG